MFQELIGFEVIEGGTRHARLLVFVNAFCRMIIMLDGTCLYLDKYNPLQRSWFDGDEIDFAKAIAEGPFNYRKAFPA